MGLFGGFVEGSYGASLWRLHRLSFGFYEGPDRVSIVSGLCRLYTIQDGLLVAFIGLFRRVL